MPPAPVIKKKSSNANPLRRSAPAKRPGLGSSSNGSATSTRRGPNVLGAGGTAGKNGSMNSSTSSTDSNQSNASNYTDFKLRCCSADEVTGLRHHIMKFHSRTHVDPAKSFTQPVRLHRKDPRNMQNQLTLSELEERRKRGGENADTNVFVNNEVLSGDADSSTEQKVKTEGGATEENTNGEKAGEEKGKKAAAADDKGKNPAEAVDLSLIAPDGGARRAKLNPFQKKTRQVVLGDESARKLRYEEHYPWIMEDFDGQNTWVGNYEAGQADSFVLFVFDADGFKMVPAEKYYKMTPRNKYQTFSAEEAEKRMQKGEQPNRWVMKYFPGEGEEGGSGSSHSVSKPTNMRRRFRTVDTYTPDEDSIRRIEDQEEIDFDEEFADDEEAPIMDGNEEDVKEVEKKIKKELRGDATDSLFNESDEEDESKSKMDKTGLKLIKSLRSLEKNGNYESDEDINPYATEESSSDEEIETAEAGASIKEEEKEMDPTKGGKTVSASATGMPGADTIKKEKKEKKIKKDKLKKDKKKKKGQNVEIDSETGKKIYTNLSMGMVVLQLSPTALGNFPPNVWNPNLKRRRVEENIEGDAGSKGPKTKKIKIKTEPNVSEANSLPPISAPSSSPATVSGTPLAATSAQGKSTGSISRQGSPENGTGNATRAIPEPTDADLITEEDVASIIRSSRVTAKQLLTLLKPKLKKHPRNNGLLKALVPRIAKLSDGFLVLKE